VVVLMVMLEVRLGFGERELSPEYQIVFQTRSTRNTTYHGEEE
jgi:hypothetical protein